MSEYKRPQLERHEDGTIKDFSIPDANTLFVSCRSATNPEVAYFTEDIVLFSLDELNHLDTLVDPADGHTLAEKWIVTPEIIKDLKSKGEASQVQHPFVYTYFIRKTFHADDLKHLG